MLSAGAPPRPPSSGNDSSSRPFSSVSPTVAKSYRGLVTRFSAAAHPSPALCSLATALAPPSAHTHARWRVCPLRWPRTCAESVGILVWLPWVSRPGDTFQGGNCESSPGVTWLLSQPPARSPKAQRLPGSFSGPLGVGGSPWASSRRAPVGACPCLRGCCGCFTVNQAGFSFCCSEQVKGETC